MDVVETAREVRAWRLGRPGTLGFVPTMGYLHDGHLALVHAARQRCDLVAASIFVNPAQFGPGEDLDRYPRDLDRDLALLRDAGAHLVFVPDVAEMYPPGFDTWVEPGAVASTLEGARRPGHFRGVATVVTRLFGIVRPDVACFGAKDIQQCAVVERLVEDLALPVEIVVVPTVREPDGLALSSRNVYLTPAERKAATVLSRSLAAAVDAWRQGERSASRLQALVRTVVATEPLVTLEYVAVSDRRSMQEVAVAGPGTVISLAARAGKARLIDNMTLEPAAAPAEH